MAAAAVVTEPLTLRTPEGEQLKGILFSPPQTETCKGLVVFAHGSGSSHQSPRNQMVASMLSQVGLSSALVDLLTESEDAKTRAIRFNITFLSTRLNGVLDELYKAKPQLADVPLGLFGASTGAASAIDVSAMRGDQVKAVVSRGGRPDMATHLSDITAPTLLIIGGNDTEVIDLNRQAFDKLEKVEHKSLRIVPGATHLFDEPGTLQQAAEAAKNWFLLWLVTETHKKVSATLAAESEAAAADMEKKEQKEGPQAQNKETKKQEQEMSSSSEKGESVASETAKKEEVQ